MAISTFSRIAAGDRGKGNSSRTARSADLALAEDLLGAGFSALMLLLLSHWSRSWWFCLPAVLPYFCRLNRADVRRSVRLGVTLASAYVLVACTRNLLSAPGLLLIQLLCLNLVFVSFGLAVVWSRSVFGCSPLLLFLLWFPLEYVLRRLGVLNALLAFDAADSTAAVRVLALMQGLALILAFVLFNPILLLIVSCVVERVLGRSGPLRIDRRGQSPTSIAVLVRQWYSFPDLRSPPASVNCEKFHEWNHSAGSQATSLTRAATRDAEG